MNYHYGQAPSQTPALPFTYQPPGARTNIPMNPTPHFGLAAPVGFPRPQPAAQPSVNPYAYVFSSAQPHAVPIQPSSIKSATEIYPSTSWSGASAQSVSHQPMQNQQFAQPSYGAYMPRPAKGGKGRGKGNWRPGQPQALANAANAIPLGKQRVFASSPEDSTPEAELRREEAGRPPADHRPVRVIGRGRALTVPAWAKEQESRAPGERADERRDTREPEYRRPDSVRMQSGDSVRPEAGRSYGQDDTYRRADSRPPAQEFHRPMTARGVSERDEPRRPVSQHEETHGPDRGDSRGPVVEREEPRRPATGHEEPRRPERDDSLRPVAAREVSHRAVREPEEARREVSRGSGRRDGPPEEPKSYRSSRDDTYRGEERSWRKRSRSPVERRVRRESPVRSARTRKESPEYRRRW